MIKKNRFAVKVFISQPFRILISLTRDKTGQETRDKIQEDKTGRDPRVEIFLITIIMSFQD